MSDNTDKLSTDSTAILGTGTARMADGTARMNTSQSASPAGVGTIFAEGQTIVLNGKNCVIEKLISMGSGEAVVYKMSIDGKPYALKHYKPNTPLGETAKKVLAKIRDNPKDRIVRIFDFGSYNGQDFEIMEYAEGGTLGDYVKKHGAIRDANLKGVVKQLNEGLQQLHGFYKVIYQDLKPENIFFRDAQRSSLVLADFGISNVMQDGSEEALVTVNVTDLYGAPELAHKADRTKGIVTPAVDYFALGITMYELWLGAKPVVGINNVELWDRHIRNKNVGFPADMPADSKTLIQGLLEPNDKDRMGNEHVQKWLKGEALASDGKKPAAVTGTVYKPLKFGNEFASTPQEMAALMEKYPDAGKLCLYDDFITSNLKEAGDVTLYTEIKNVISQYGNDQEAGLTAAIYTLDPERPFKSRGGKICENTEEIADAIMADSAHYMEDLKKPNAGLYVYLAVTGGSQGKEVAQDFCNYFKQYTPNRTLTLIYLKLQSDGAIPIGSKRYLSTDELAQEKDKAQIDLIKKMVKEKDSPLLVWLSAEYGDYFKSTDEFNKLSTPEQFFLLGLLPFLSYKELTNSNGELALKNLIDNYSGRSELFEAYAAQGLPLKGQIIAWVSGFWETDSSVKKTPIDYVVRDFNDLSTKHSVATINNLIRLLCKLGADVNECSNDNRYPLRTAYEANDNALVNLLLANGADRGKYDELVAQRAEKERIIQEKKQQQLKYNGCISAGESHTVALKTDGMVVAVGNNGEDKCNTGEWRDIDAVSTGRYHTVGLKADGTVVAVGENRRISKDWKKKQIPKVREDSKVRELSKLEKEYAKIQEHLSGIWDGMSRTSETKEYLKEIGCDLDVFDDKPLVVDGEIIEKWTYCGQCHTSDWRDIVAVSAGDHHTLGLKVDGTVVAVGDKEYDQCNTSDWRDIIAVSAGGSHTLGLKADGTVVVVGKNEEGQCNTGGWRGIVAISAGSTHTVGLKADGTVVAVGKNEEGQCNTGNWRDIVAVSAGSSHTLGLKADGTVVAVGNNDKGQCNTGGWRDIIAVSAGEAHTVGLKADGTVVAVGKNEEGQCNIGIWQNIGPLDKKQIEVRREADKKQIEEQKEADHQKHLEANNKRLEEGRRKLEEERRIEQSNKWASQGLCRHCGGQLGGLFTKKCKSCGKEQ
jgi:alpha-tubulin suppressor-like RCC1 family protein